jgi:hypothetical protein
LFKGRDIKMAKTSAQRQKDFRDKHLGSYNSRRVNTIVSSSAYWALKRLAKRSGLSMKEMIETLALSEDMAIQEKLKVDTPEWDDYFGSTGSGVE